MFKKVLASLATIGLALGMVAATATSASAHHNTISAVITCNTDTYKYDVTWSVSNSESLTETITASSDENLVPSTTTTLGDKETKYFYETFDSPVNKTLTLSAKWTNNQTNTSEGSIKKNQFPDCAPNHVPVTICHATPPDTAAQGWESITIDDDAIVKQGHAGQHALDIIPAFNYWEKVNDVWTMQYFPGKNLDTVFSGHSGSAILTAGCSMTTSPGAPTFAPAECTAPGVAGQGSYTIPNTPGVVYSVRLNNTGGYVDTAANTYPVPIGTVIDVKATSTLVWLKLQAPTSWNYTVPSPGDCIVEVTPVFPNVQNITACGVYGSVTPQVTTGVVYSLVLGDGLQGAFTIKAVPAFGYKFLGAQEVLFQGNLGIFTKCATPVEPSFVDSECTGPGTDSDGSYTIPATEGVQFQVKIGDDPWANADAGTSYVSAFPVTVQVQAIALDGYTLKDYTGPWEHTFNSAGECLVKATPVEPTVVPITECDTYGSVTPKVTTGVVYELTAGNGTSGAYTITATPAPGFYFDDDEDQKITFTGDLGVYTECVTALEPGFTDSECSPEPPLEEEPELDAASLEFAATGFVVPGYFTIPSKAGVQYSVSINDGPFSDYSAGDYEVADGDKVVVKASALPGYTLEGTSEWSHTFGLLGVCELPTKAEVQAAASAKSATCTAEGAIMVELADHVLYYLGAEQLTAASTPKAPGTYVVTATTDSVDYTIIGQKSWTLVVTAASGCSTPAVLASTGGTASLLGLSLGGGLLFLGVAAIYMRRRSGEVTE